MNFVSFCGILLLSCFTATLVSAKPGGKCTFQTALDHGASFCQNVPSDAAIGRDKMQCAKNTNGMFTLPLEELRECCDSYNSLIRDQCLKSNLTKELEINRLFLSWEDTPERNAQYCTNLGLFKSQYRGLDISFRKCYNGPIDELRSNVNEVCMDPVGIYEQVCSESDWRSRGDFCCKKVMTEIRREGLEGGLCFSDRTIADKKAETVHYKCFDQQALVYSQRGLRANAYWIDNSCIFDAELGIGTSYYLLEKADRFKNAMPASFIERMMAPHAGVYENITALADQFLGTVCQSDETRKCLETPITQTFLTARSKDDIGKCVQDCCSASNDGENVKALRSCFKQNDMYEQFIQLGGFFMRSIFRQQTGTVMECLNDVIMNDRSVPDKVQRPGADGNERRFGSSEEFENGFKLSQLEKMNSSNYHFWLRNITGFTNGSMFDAACSACRKGEQLGLQAYVFPGYMCPVLAARTFYLPAVTEATCPQNRFYETQVAHYCCLMSAYKKHHFYNFNPTATPDLSGIKDELVE